MIGCYVGAVSRGRLTTEAELPPIDFAPELQSIGYISGEPKIGETLTHVGLSFIGLPTPSVSRQWLRSGTPIVGATGETYVPVDADDLTNVSCQVSLSNTEGSTTPTATSAVAITYVAPVYVPDFADILVDQGDTLTGDPSSSFVGGGIVWSYSGLPAGSSFSSSTSVFTASTAATGRFDCTVTATNSGGTVSVDFTIRVQYVPVWATTAGAGYLAFNASTGFEPFVDSNKFTAAIALRNTNNVSGLARLFDINGRYKLEISGTNLLNVESETTTNGVYLSQWFSTANIRQAGITIIHIVQDHADPASVRHYINGVLVPGTFGLGPIVGTLDLTRSDAAQDYSLLASATGTLKYNGEVAWAYMESGVAREPDVFWHPDGFMLDPRTVGSPQVRFVGAGLTTGDNTGAGSPADWTVVGGTVALVDAPPTLATTAFPDARGFGKDATGGRGGNKYIVDILDGGVVSTSATSGSLAWALAQPGPRVIIATKEGYVNLPGELDVPDDTSLFSIAPGIGFCVRFSRLSVKGSNVIFNNVNFMPTGSYFDTATGDFATGGAGGTAYVVTNNSGSAATSGSLPWALAQAGPKTISFSAQMTYAGTTSLLVPDDTTVDGASAPGTGFSINMDLISVSGRRNVIVRNLRSTTAVNGVFYMRAAGAAGQPINERDGGSIGDSRGTGSPVSDVYMRRCSFWAAPDENLTTWSNSATRKVTKVTIDKCISAEGVVASGNTNGDLHAMGFLIGAYSEEITSIDSLYATNAYRNPQIQSATRKIEFLNNWVYNFGYNGTEMENTDHQTHVLNNAYDAGPIDQVNRPISIRGHTAATAYVAGNEWKRGGATVTTQSGLIRYSNSTVANAELSVTELFTPSITTASLLAVGSVRSNIASKAGATAAGGARHPTIQRIVDYCAAGTGPAVLLPAADAPALLAAPTGAAAGATGSSNGILAGYETAIGYNTTMSGVVASGPWTGFEEWERQARWLETGSLTI